MHVLEAITEVMADLAKEGISKDRRNQQQGYSFRGIDDVYNALAPILSKRKLVIIPNILDRTCEPRETAKGGTLYSVTVTVQYRVFSAVDGSEVIVRTMGEAMDSGDKATNKAMSAAYKYMAIQTFAIPTEGDNDADAVTPPETIVQRAKEKAEELPQTRGDAQIAESIIEGLGVAPDVPTLEADLKKASRFLHSLKARRPELYEQIREATYAARQRINATEAFA